MRRIALILTILTAHAGLTLRADEPQTERRLPQRLLERFDTNKDGRLDSAERAAARKAREERAGQAPNKKGANQSDRKRTARDSAKKGTSDTRGAFLKRLLERFDANNNGKLDPEEIARARQQRDQFQKKGNGQTKKGAATDRQRGLNRQQLLKRFDANQNGRLDPPEMARLRKAFPQADRRRPGQTDRNKTDRNKTDMAGDRKKRPRNSNDRPAMNAQLLKRFDENSNGRLDPDELAKLREFRRRMGANRNGRGNFNQSAPERPARVDQKPLLEQFDRDGSGQLDGDERTKALEALKKKAS